MTFLLLLALARDIDAFAKKAVPANTAIVVVQNDRVVYQSGPKSQFYIASSTKAFTAMAAAVLAAEGRVNLDEPIADLRGASLRDLLAMRPPFANDTINYRSAMPGNITSDDELMRLVSTYSRDVPRTFRYSNASYVLAARAMEKATGATWRNLISQKVLVLLGMTSTVMNVPPGNAIKQQETMTAAGGMFTTTDDAARWLIAMLNDGRIDGKQALPARAVRLVQSEQTTNIAKYRYIDRFAWGLGEDLGTYDGDLIVHRFGGYKDAYSHISFMPAQHIGVAVFTNGSSAAADALALYAYDRILGKNTTKWTAELAKINSEPKKEPAAPARQTASRPLADYAGTYVSDRLGTIVVRENAGKLEAQFGVLQAELIPTGGDTFAFDWTGDGEWNRVTIAETKFDWEGRLFEKERR